MVFQPVGLEKISGPANFPPFFQPIIFHQKHPKFKALHLFLCFTAIMQADQRTSENFEAYMKSLAPASAQKYREWCESFDEWTNEHKDESLAQNLLDYFESCHDHG